MRDIPLEENRLFRERYLPRGEILSVCDSRNRLLWYVEYATISVEVCVFDLGKVETKKILCFEAIAHAMRTSESIRLQFYEFEHMLRCVNAHEARTGRLSSLRHIVDMAGYELNPFTALFVSKIKKHAMRQSSRVACS